MKRHMYCVTAAALAALAVLIGACDGGVAMGGGDVPEGQYSITILPAAEEIFSLVKPYGLPKEEITVNQLVLKDEDEKDITPVIWQENEDGEQKTITWLRTRSGEQVIFDMPAAPVFISIVGDKDAPDSGDNGDGDGKPVINEYLKKAVFGDKEDSSTVWLETSISHTAENAKEFDVSKANATIKVSVELEEGSYTVAYRLASSGNLTTVSGGSFEVAGPASGAPVYIEIHVSGTETHIYKYTANYKGEEKKDPEPTPDPDVKSALLKSLAIPGITFTFASTTYSYDFSASPVTSTLTSINITPVAESASAAITIGSAAVISGTSYSASLTNSGGTANTFNINVVDGTESKTYTVKIYRSLSGDNGLSSVSINDDAAYTKMYSPVTNQSYDLNTDATPLPPASDKLYFKLITSHAKASVKVNSVAATLASGVYSATAAVSTVLPGYNTITVAVTAEDGSVKNYTFKAYRDYQRSTNANLAAIVPIQSEQRYATSDLYPKFNKDVLEYTLYTNTNDKAKPVVFNYVVEDANAKAKDNNAIGISFTGKETTGAVNTLATPYKITVTAEDGKTTKEYVIGKYIVVSKVSGSDKLPQASGGTISYVGTDEELHVFHKTETSDDSSFSELKDTFTFLVGMPSKTWLLINGGGGGGGYVKTYGGLEKDGGGGGGGGRVEEYTDYKFNNVDYTGKTLSIVVGAGGLGGKDDHWEGYDGGESSISYNGTTIIKAGGGGGGEPGMDRDDDKRKDKTWSTKWGYGGGVGAGAAAESGGGQGGAGGQWYSATDMDFNSKISYGGQGGGGGEPGQKDQYGRNTNYGHSSQASRGSVNGGFGGDGYNSSITGTSYEYGAGGAGGFTNHVGADGGSGGNAQTTLYSGTEKNIKYDYDYTNKNWKGEYGQKYATADGDSDGTKARRGGNGYVIIRFKRINTDTRPAR